MEFSTQIFANFVNINENTVVALYLISLMIARSGEPLAIFEDLILSSTKDGIGIMFIKKIIMRIELRPDPKIMLCDEMSKWAEE